MAYTFLVNNDQGGTSACPGQTPSDADRPWVAQGLSEDLEISVRLRIPPLLLAAIVDQITKSLWDLDLERPRAFLCVKPETAAKMMNVSGRQLKRYVDEGKIEVTDLGTKCKRIRLVEIERFVKEHTRKQSSINSATRPSGKEPTSSSTPVVRQATEKAAPNVAPNRSLTVLVQQRKIQDVSHGKRKPRRRKSLNILDTK